MHFLFTKKGNISHTICLRKPHACVTVQVAGKKTLKAIAGSINILRDDAQLVALPSDVSVVDEQGNAIKPSRGFYVTTETFDPFHVLVDARVE